MAVVYKLYRFRCHDSLAYFEQEEQSNPPALQKTNARAKELFALFDEVQEDTTWRDLGYRFYYKAEGAYDYVQSLSDDELESILITLEVLQFGQLDCECLDTDEGSIFNRVAADLGVDMRDYWRPDESFLKRRNKAQLQQIITDSGCSNLFGSVAGWKKKELVSKLAIHFQSVITLEAPDEDALKAIFWIPEAMAFPAIDPDAKKEPEESFDEAEEAFSEAA